MRDDAVRPIASSGEHGAPRRFGVRALFGLVAVLFGALPFLVLLLLVTRRWAPLAATDQGVADGLNSLVRGSPLLQTMLRLTTDLGGTGTAVWLLTLATVALLIRGRRRLAASTVTTGVGLAVLVPVTKALVDRVRPVVEVPVVATPGNASFPSGHAATAVVTFGTGAAGPAGDPAVPAGRGRPVATGRRDHGAPPGVGGNGGVGGGDGARLLVTATASGTWLGRWDRALPAALVDLRTPTRTSVVEAVGDLAGTRGIVAVSLTTAVLAVAITRRRRPALFVVVATAGEVLLYAAVTSVVDRARPSVVDLTDGLPVAASWPSGYVAAATVVYGAAAVLLTTGRSPRWRALFAVPAALVLAIGFSRMYVAAHHLTDVLAGLLLGTAWLALCTLVIRPMPATAEPGDRRSAPESRPVTPRGTARPRRAG